jgi:HEPN domain-containing protein
MPGPELVIANLLRVANEDLAGARALAAIGNRNAIYLCEQAAEKTIRAVLTSEGVHAGIGHDLRAFVDKVPDANPLKPELRSVEHLGTFATAYRYPSPEGRIKAQPPREDIEREATKVESAIRTISQRLGVDLVKANTPAARPGPIRP